MIVLDVRGEEKASIRSWKTFCTLFNEISIECGN